jgi:malate dehydrogenase (oxaloacetate-decarboxylating)
MLDFKHIKNPKTQEEYIETSLAGKLLLTIPQLNKGTAFTEQERHIFSLLGKLPAQIETLEEQVKRTYMQVQGYTTPIQKHIYLNTLHDKNQVLFYKLISEHVEEMLPLIYTPIVGQAVKEYSREFRQARGLYIAYPHRNQIEEILDNRSHPEIDLIVVTDGEGILGIGDQGVGGMNIPIAKLMVYTLCAGINPLRTLPIMLDVGTNNQTLLNDPMYFGLRHPRITGQDYDDFIDAFVTAVHKKFPNAFLHWEDFGRNNARKILDRYRDKVCTFNDDIQGTAAVTLAALLAAVKSQGAALKDQNIVIFGAGSAGTGIADQICNAMCFEGLDLTQARKNIWLVDKQGLLTQNMQDLTSAQQPYARNSAELNDWEINNKNYINLLEAIKNIKPAILIGCSAQSGAFNEAIVMEMAKHHNHPIIFPLSNPTENAEATPAQLLEWTQGKAIIATGSPFNDVAWNNKTILVTQCNNALSFPGIGLGVIAAQAKFLSEAMLWAACKTLSEYSPILKDPQGSLLPAISKVKPIAKKIALAVAEQARQEGLAQIAADADLNQIIDAMIWSPQYIPLRRKLFNGK